MTRASGWWRTHQPKRAYPLPRALRVNGFGDLGQELDDIDRQSSALLLPAGFVVEKIEKLRRAWDDNHQVASAADDCRPVM
ncbi:MAG: hypothetical protein JNL98_11325 [Bryobacterales bacterium]|nr:hypothetical protein [Bryobacterales bacterium]